MSCASLLVSRSLSPSQSYNHRFREEPGLGSPLNSGLPNLVPPECAIPRQHALLLITSEPAWYKDPNGSKHGSKLICFAGYHSADSMVSGSKWIQVDPSADPSSYALLAIIRQTPWYQDPSGSKLGSKHFSGKHNDILTKTNPHTDLIIILLKAVGDRTRVAKALL